MPKVARFHQIGGPEVLKIEEQQSRQPGIGEVAGDRLEHRGSTIREKRRSICCGLQGRMEPAETRAIMCIGDG